MKKSTSIPPLVIVLLFATTLNAAPLVVVDQQNLIVDAVVLSGQSIIGQTFVPTLPAIDAFEFDLGALTGGTQIYINLRDGVAGTNGLQGAILGTTNTVVLPSEAPNEMTHFDFPTSIALIPGKKYVAEVVGTNGQRASLSFDDRYPAGESLVIVTPGRDLIFREGLHVPEPSAAILAIVAAALLSSFTDGRGRRPGGCHGTR
ncbi:MAG: hypothetical protein WD669_08535 [Pirellulales bacterium]